VHRVIVGTSAFGMSVDYPYVRHVFHHGLPSNVMNYMQEVGRIGRDGEGGEGIILLPRGAMPIDDERWE